MQWSLRLNHGRFSPSTSIRRKPVRSMSRIAASPVGCSPSAASLAHHASEMTEFGFAQSALAAPDGKLPNTFRRVPADDAEASGMAEQCPQVY